MYAMGKDSNFILNFCLHNMSVSFVLVPHINILTRSGGLVHTMVTHVPSRTLPRPLVSFDNCVKVLIY